MEKLPLKDDFGRQILEWDDTAITGKYKRNFLGQPDLTKRQMREVLMQTPETASTRQATESILEYT